MLRVPSGTRAVKDTDGFYRVDRMGQVWSSRKCGKTNDRRGLWKVLKPAKVRGYSVVVICRDGSKKMVPVHRLVLGTFRGPCPPGKEARHFPNRDKSDNRLVNLRWGTRKENQRDRIKHGTSNRRFPISFVRKLRRAYATGLFTFERLGKVFGLSASSAGDIITNRTYQMLIPFQYLFQRYNIKSSTVLHLGANTGQEAEAYFKHGVRKAIWVEALPHIYKQLILHLSRFDYKRLGMENVCLQACVSDKDDQDVNFHVSSNFGQSSSMLEFGTHTTAHPEVRFTSDIQLRTKRVDTMLRENGIEIPQGSFLNIDLQGAELLALKGMGDSLLFNFDYAYIEVNEKELYKGCPKTPEIDAHLAKFGFVPQETQMTNWGWGDRFYIQEEVKKKKIVEAVFTDLSRD